MKMTFFILILFYFFTVNFSGAYTLKTGVIYNVNIARNQAFSNTPLKIDMTDYSNYKIDVENINNINAARKGKNKYKGKYITLFSDGAYSIRYKKSENPCFYYDSNGNLISLGFIYGEKYPKKYLSYDKNGQLLDITLYVSGKEQYVFNLAGTLIEHWIGNNCYNEKGELILTRE